MIGDMCGDRSRSVHDDRGQTLVIVILFISVFALLIPPLLGAVSVGVTSSRKQADLARNREAADAGAEYALRRVKVGVAGALGSAAVNEALPGTINGDSVNVSITRRAITGISVVGPATLGGPNCRGFFTVRITDDGTTLPYGAQWSVTPDPTSLDQGGRLTPTLSSTTYTITATLANVSASTTVAVGGTVCP